MHSKSIAVGECFESAVGCDCGYLKKFNVKESQILAYVVRGVAAQRGWLCQEELTVADGEDDHRCSIQTESEWSLVGVNSLQEIIKCTGYRIYDDKYYKLYAVTNRNFTMFETSKLHYNTIVANCINTFFYIDLIFIIVIVCSVYFFRLQQVGYHTCRQFSSYCLYWFSILDQVRYHTSSAQVKSQLSFSEWNKR